MSWELIISEVALAVATFAACISVNNFMTHKYNEYNEYDMQLAYIQGYEDKMRGVEFDCTKVVSK